MKRTNVDRLKHVYFIINKASEPRISIYWIGVIALFVSLSTLIGIVLGWFEGIVGIDILAAIVTLPLVIIFILMAIHLTAFWFDVILLKRSVRRLRYGNWDFLCYVVLDRPISSKIVLSDPTVIFIIGHLFRKLDYQTESNDLISKSINALPSLASIRFSESDILSAPDERFLLSELDKISRYSYLIRLLSNRRKGVKKSLESLESLGTDS